jgi:hypothetical protein
MRIDQLKPSAIVRGPIFSEPIQVIVIIPMGQSVKLVGKGLTTGAGTRADTERRTSGFIGSGI